MTHRPLIEDTRVTESCGNVFVDLGFPPHEAEVLQLRSDLMARLRLWIRESELTQAEAAERLGITQERVSDLARGKWKKFSLELLITLAARTGMKIRLELDEAA
jgi:predicted XRE-type DNA-binding protein